jgi:hypothetical protein
LKNYTEEVKQELTKKSLRLNCEDIGLEKYILENIIIDLG